MQYTYVMNRYTKEILEDAVKNSKSWAGACRLLGVTPQTGAQTHVKNRAVHFGVDFSHFTGSGWNKGKKFPPKRNIQEYLVETPTAHINSGKLRDKLIKEGLKNNECELCKGTTWLSANIPLELHHINRDHFDNRIENLMILCPNCHAFIQREGATKARRSKMQSSKAETKHAKQRVHKESKCKCIKCGNVRSYSNKSKLCINCYIKSREKIEWPGKEELERMVWNIPSSILATKFGVSDSAIKKRCMKLGISKPTRGYWAKLAAGKLDTRASNTV